MNSIIGISMGVLLVRIEFIISQAKVVVFSTEK
jgi:hypothetical protein